MEATAADVKKPSGKSDKDVTILICSADEDREFTFDKNAKIGEVIDKVVDAFGLSKNDTYSLVFPDQPKEPLDKNRPLVSYHIKDGTKLILTSVGGGV